LTEERLEYAFITAINQILAVKDDYFVEYETVVEELTNTTTLDREAEKLNVASEPTISCLTVKQGELRTLNPRTQNEADSPQTP
jgi:hypothetical protein